MTIVDTILIAVVMLLGDEGVHYVMLERDPDGWKVVGDQRRN